MKRLLLILATILVAMGLAAQPRGHTSNIKGSLKDYKYVYIVSHADPFFTNTLSFGSPTKKVNLTELAKDFYTRLGYKVVQKIDPKSADKTLVVSYGRERRVNSSLVYTNGVYLQINDAKTNKLLAIYEADGRGSNATEELVHAFHNALDLFYYTLHPKVVAKIVDESGSRVELELTNQTPYYIEKMTVRLMYYQGDNFVCEQEKTLSPQLVQGETLVTRVKRMKEARNSNYTVKVKVDK